MMSIWCLAQWLPLNKWPQNSSYHWDVVNILATALLFCFVSSRIMLPYFGLLHYGSLYQRHLPQSKRNPEWVSHTWKGDYARSRTFVLPYCKSCFCLSDVSLLSWVWRGCFNRKRIRQIIGFVLFNHCEDTGNLHSKIK